MHFIRNEQRKRYTIGIAHEQTRQDVKGSRIGGEGKGFSPPSNGHATGSESHRTASSSESLPRI